MFNRLKLGRTLDEAHAYGCALLLSELALAVCQQERMDFCFHHLDTTSFALTGAYVPESDTQAMAITHGDSKDPRPDLQQAVLELMVSQDGGVPLVSKSWDGNTAETQMFQERAQAFMQTFARSPPPRYGVADAKLYTEENAATLHKLGFITRMPNTCKLVAQVIGQALQWATWQRVDDTTRYQRIELGHYGRAQRGLVVYAQAAFERAEATVSKAQQREYAAIDKHLFHLQAPRFETPEAAQAALAAVAKRWKYHQVEHHPLIEPKRYGGKGRPTSTTPIQAIAWPIQARVRPDAAHLAHLKHSKACLVLGSHLAGSQASDTEVSQAYKGQAQAAGGFRFLQDPLCFVSSLLVQKPCRMQGLLMVMTWAVLVYAVAQRRLRQQRARPNETVPNQINQPTQRPPWRWIFQLLDGIHRVRVTGQGRVHDFIEGLNDVKRKVLRLFGEGVCRLYQISPG
jgi:transposase